MSGESEGVSDVYDVSSDIKLGLEECLQCLTVIVGVCHQAPYGKGSETVVDTAVRRTWELSTCQSELRNPEWTRVLGEVVKGVAADLDVPRGEVRIKAIPCKMLLSEKNQCLESIKSELTLQLLWN